MNSTDFDIATDDPRRRLHRASSICLRAVHGL